MPMRMPVILATYEARWTSNTSHLKVVVVEMFLSEHDIGDVEFWVYTEVGELPSGEMRLKFKDLAQAMDRAALEVKCELNGLDFEVASR